MRAKAGAGEAARTATCDFRLVRRAASTRDDIAILTRQLATLVGAGIPLVEALAALVDQVEHERLKRISRQVKQRVNEGTSLADALAEPPQGLQQPVRQHDPRGRELGRAGRGAHPARRLHRGPGRAAQQGASARMAYPAIMVLMAIVIVDDPVRRS